MLLYKLFSILGLAFIASAYKAPISRDSPRGVAYVAEFTRGDVKGFVRIYSRLGFGRYHIDVKGLPKGGSPVTYSIHRRPVPPNGDCNGALSDFNPYGGIVNGRCQNEFAVGDLSGKHGKIRGTKYKNTFFDIFISLNPKNHAFVGDLSIVFFKDFKRIACANLKQETGAIQHAIGANSENIEKEPEPLNEEASKAFEKDVENQSNMVEDKVDDQANL